MFMASSGEMPKNSASKRSMLPPRKPPKRVYILPAASGFGSKNASTSHRDGGTSTTASVAFSSSRQYASGESAPPGKRQPAPMMAIGSCCARFALASSARRL